MNMLRAPATIKAPASDLNKTISSYTEAQTDPESGVYSRWRLLSIYMAHSVAGPHAALNKWVQDRRSTTDFYCFVHVVLVKALWHGLENSE